MVILSRSWYTRSYLLFLLGLAGACWDVENVLVRASVLIKQLRSVGFFSLLFFAIISIYMLYISANVTSNYDTGLYHAQAIRWIESFDVVPGLANLSIRLGFNSNLFLLAAFWGFAGLGLHLYQIPSLMVFVCFTFYELYLVEKLRGNLNFTGIAALGLLICFPFIKMFMEWLGSATPDFPTTIITWMIFLFALEKAETGRSKQLDLYTITIMVLCLFDVTIKLSSLPILFVSAYFLWEARSSLSLSSALVLVLLFSVILFSWIARNIMLTGYLLFPFAQLDIFRFDWKVPPDMVQQQALAIAAWARIPHQDSSLVMSMPLGQWLPIWYRGLLPNDSLLLIGIAIGISLLVILIVANREVRRQIRDYVPFYVITIVGVVFWFVQAPWLKFGYGFLVTLLVFLYVPFLALLLRRCNFFSRWFILTVQSLLIIFILAAIIHIPLKSWSHFMDTIRPYPQSATKPLVLGHQKFFLLVTGDQCWYDAFPCIPSEVLIPGLTMRGSSLQEGFRISSK